MTLGAEVLAGLLEETNVRKFDNRDKPKVGGKAKFPRKETRNGYKLYARKESEWEKMPCILYRGWACAEASPPGYETWETMRERLYCSRNPEKAMEKFDDLNGWKWVGQSK